MNEKEIVNLGKKAKRRISDAYSWKYISDKYKEIFVHEK